MKTLKSIFASLLGTKKEKQMNRTKQKRKYYDKGNGKFVTWKYESGQPCFCIGKKTDIVGALLLDDSRKLQGFFYKGYFVKNVLKPRKQKFLQGNYFQFIYKMVYVGYKIADGERMKLYQLKQVARYM